MIWRKTVSGLVGVIITLSAIGVYGSYVAEIMTLWSPTPHPVSQQAQEDYQLGIDSISGNQGVTPDISRALMLVTRSAGQGNPEAQFELGNIYYHGVFGQDYRKAFIWFALAADSGYQKAAAFRYETGAFLSPAELLSAQQEMALLQDQMKHK
jgi:TPR repeat protein